MAHFAQLNENNVVIYVTPMSNTLITDEDGKEQESLGIEFLKNQFGDDTTWVQTSYNNNFRCRYAGIGSIYDESLDAFIPPNPFPSWIFDENSLDWIPPVERPQHIEGGPLYDWNEELKNWVPVYMNDQD
jgi:hypothetical protein